MSNLENLVFTANTDSLKAAVGVIGEVSKAMLDLGKVNTALAKTTKDVAKAQADSEKVNQEVAKTAVVEAKASRDVAKAKLEEIKATEASTKATRDNSEVTKESISLSERLTDIRNFMAAGSSKGEASMLASAKAQKANNEELNKSIEIQKEIRSLQGGNPFDKSIGGLIALKNELRELIEVQTQYANNSGLTSAQAKTLAQDKLRLGILHEQRGELGLLDAALKQHTASTIAEANAVNTLIAATKEIDRQQREVANSTRAVAKEEEKMLFAMEAINTVRGNGSRAAAQQAINEATYARNVRLSGVSAEEAAKKIKLYGEQQTALAAAEEKHKVDYVTRAVGPQLTDIFSGLATGQQSLYTIAIQQGGQLMDQFALSGIEANKMKDILAQAVPNMLENIKKVALAFGGILTGAISTVGTALKELVAGSFSLVVEGFSAITAGTDGTAAAIERLKIASATLAKTGVFILVTALAALSVAYYESMKQQETLTSSIILTGAALGMTRESALEFAKSIEGVSNSRAIDALTAFADESIRGDENIKGLTKAAVDLEKYAGVAISDTAKEYKKLQTDPIKALEELGIKTGRVTEETMNHALALKEAGHDAELLTLSELELIRVTQLLADQSKASLSPISILWLDIKSAIASAWSEIKEFSSSSLLVSIAATAFAGLSLVVSQVWFWVKALTLALTTMAAQLVALAHLDFSAMVGLGRDMVNNIGVLADEQDVYIKKVLEGTTAVQAMTQEQADQYKANTKMSKDARTNAESNEKLNKENLNLKKRQISMVEYMAEKEKDYRKELGDTVVTEKNLQLVRENAQLQWMKANKERAVTKDNFHLVISPLDELRAVEANYKDSMKNILTIYSDEERALKSKLSNHRITQDEFDERMKNLTDKANNDQLVSYNDYSAKEFEAVKAGLDRIEKERKDSIAANKDADNVPKINEKADAAVKALLESERKFFQDMNTNRDLTTKKMATDAAEANDKHQGSIINATHEYIKLEAAITAGRAAVEQENKATEFKASLIGKTADEQLKLTRAYEYQTKLTKIQVDLDKELVKIEQDRILNADPILKEALKSDARELAVDQRKALNLSVAVTAAEDFHKEMEKVSKPIADAMTIALFEGGQKGAKSLRDSVVAAFKNKITVTIDAMINADLRNLLGGAAGTTGTTTAGHSLANALGSGVGSAYSGFTGAASTTMSNGLISGFGANMSNISTLASGGEYAMSAGAAAPYVLAAIAAYKVIDSATSGEERTGGQYGLAINGVATNNRRGTTVAGNGITFLEGPSGGEGANAAAVKTSISATTDSINALLLGFGSKATLAGYQAGYETSGNGRGGVFTGGTLSSGGTFGASGKGDNYNGTLYDTTSSNSPDYSTVMKNFAADLQRSTIEALQAADLGGPIADYLTKLGDVETMTNEVVATKLTEITTYQALDAATKKMPFEYLKNMTVEAGLKLVNVAGGLSNLSTSLSGFYDKFYTEQEKTTNLTKATSAVFSQFGITMPEVNSGMREWYRSEVELLGAKDLSIDANARAYYGILSLQDAVNTLAPALVTARTQTEILTNIEKIKTDNASLQIQLLTAQGRTQEALDATRLAELSKLTDAEKVLMNQNYALEDSIKAAAKALSEKTSLQDELNKLTMDNAQLTAIQRAALDKSNLALFDQVQAIKAQQAATTAYVTEQKKVVTAAYDAQTLAINNSLTSVGTSISNLTSLSSTLKGAIVSSSVIDATTRAQAQAQLSKALLMAQSGGGLPLSTDLTSALSTVSKPSEGLFSTFTDYQRDLFKTNITLTTLSDLTDSQLSTEEQQKIILTDSLAVLKTGFDSQIAKLDELITTSALQLDAANLLNTLLNPTKTPTGTSTGTTAVFGGIQNGVGASTGTSAGKKGDGSGNFYVETGYGAGKDQQQVYDSGAIAKYTSIQSAVSQIGANPAALAEYAKANNISQNMLATATGYMYSDIQALFNNAGIPSFDVGTNFIPEDMTAQVHKGERIIPAADNSALMDRLSDPQQNSQALLEEVKRLREVVENQSYELQAIAGHTSKTAKILVRVTPDGDAMATRVAATIVGS